ncbi:hypothetical protein PNA2_1803 [Pyrococcus sp. NA2]|uniref:hypothetical protein n=1 Tax=Pyrococcus sp. (strain NA2) TaxID=342949 RepID=UPI000209AC00|nr:hypothetical protein [Pyrococcus sp. NA2]AEC52718.1 hypothetical protein PNA2_1803 [Pyrococcus sp. NA2]
MMNPSEYQFITVADFFVMALGLFMYYEFLKTGFEVFTYLRPSKLYLFTVSTISMFLTLFISVPLGILFTLLTVTLKRTGIKEAFLITVTAEFGFIIGFFILYFIFTTIGTMLGIKGLELNLDWDELLHYAMSRMGIKLIS